MTYDGTDPDDDGTVEADVDNDSVKTDDASIKSFFDVKYVPRFATAGRGTQADPWVDGWNDAMRAVPNDKLCALIAPPGHYELSGPIKTWLGIRIRQADVLGITGRINPSFFGQGRYATNIYRADGMNDDMIKIDVDPAHRDDDTLGGEFRDMLFQGNKDNNTSGDIFRVIDNSGSGDVKQYSFFNVYARRTPGWGLNDPGSHVREWDFTQTTFNRCEAGGAYIGNAGRRTSFSGCYFNFNNGGPGLSIATPDFRLSDSELALNYGPGLTIRGPANGSRVVNCVLEENNNFGNTSAAQLLNRANDTAVSVTIDPKGKGDLAIFDQGDDNDYHSMTVRNAATVFDGNAFVRPRWDGVIGGGPIGGVDLSSVTGQFEGDRAIADGTSTASEGDEATWDSSVPEWRVFQPAATV